jgi:RNA polymerase sigma-70 factor (ECF subfamily)
MDEMPMATSDATPSGSTALVDLYDRSLPDVFGYLLRRCGSRPLAEDLTSETFMAAVDAVRRDAVPELTVAWLIGVAGRSLAPP